MTRTSPWIAALLLALGLACAGETTPDPVPEPEPVAEQPAPEPSPARGKHKGKAGKRRGKAGAADDVVAAYLEDCAAVFGVDGPDSSDDECTWREFDQNCAPDPFGCFDQGEGCKDDCQPRCVGCQATCAGTCESCKSSCEGKGAACARACAEKRAACRDTCLAAKGTCEGSCGEAEGRCYDEAEKKRAEKCPRCGDLNTCQYRKMSEGKEREDCLKEFPDHAPECLDLCYEP
ncbi:MAG: hypothetical protein H6735_01700 [Alphaproteobacteria bacterium]|nr:hypothetical protein [Alphaproteobacteria bacterium]